eukprot:gnl/MRDRNA2_/MRDRNA2_84206_c0_seq1.p1 gnl/MRDRNA2_/MRDRNA2_84206_c0~~gnl/MRDRNA2_/MRDRNA2_84206_c0_seq1.p1  ORF type:complete len:201 (-),score=39.12 gnl/MRDRNA2_/MRDRNA2_84206_c0_seq1:162-764(-)
MSVMSTSSLGLRLQDICNAAGASVPKPSKPAPNRDTAPEAKQADSVPSLEQYMAMFQEEDKHQADDEPLIEEAEPRTEVQTADGDMSDESGVEEFICDEKSLESTIDGSITFNLPSSRDQNTEPPLESKATNSPLKDLLKADLEKSSETKREKGQTWNARYCTACGTPRAPTRCGRCRQAWFCNLNCQAFSWKMHKLECK